MDKIPETVLRLIWSCQILSPELPQSEVDDGKMMKVKESSSFLPQILLMLMLTNFNPLINLFLSNPV